MNSIFIIVKICGQAHSLQMITFSCHKIKLCLILFQFHTPALTGHPTRCEELIQTVQRDNEDFKGQNGGCF